MCMCVCVCVCVWCMYVCACVCVYVIGICNLGKIFISVVDEQNLQESSIKPVIVKGGK